MERIQKQLTSKKTVGFLCLLYVSLWSGSEAGEADVVRVNVTCNEDRFCDFDVTVRHADAGWDHYANRWEIVTPDGSVLATRVLAHPHDSEQPFTRSLKAVRILKYLNKVIVRANDSVHGLGGKEQVVDIPPSK